MLCLFIFINILFVRSPAHLPKHLAHMYTYTSILNPPAASTNLIIIEKLPQFILSHTHTYIHAYCPLLTIKIYAFSMELTNQITCCLRAHKHTYGCPIHLNWKNYKILFRLFSFSFIHQSILFILHLDYIFFYIRVCAKYFYNEYN